MPRVSRPLYGSVPGDCIVIPGRRSDDGGYYQFETTYDGLQGIITPYISATGIRRLAQKWPEAGLVPSEDLDRLTEAYAALELENAVLRAELDHLVAFRENLAGVAADGFRVQKRMGPKSQAKAETTAA